MNKIYENIKLIKEELGDIGSAPYSKTIRDNIKVKVFLGGTCDGEDYRTKLIPMLKVPYFNPVVDDWTKEAQEKETIEKRDLCGIHLYVITPFIKGVFSIAEAVESAMTLHKCTIFYIDSIDKFEEHMIKSLQATQDLLRRNGATIAYSIEGVASYINSYKDIIEEDFAGTTQAMSPTPIVLADKDNSTLVTIDKTNKVKKDDKNSEYKL